MWQAVDYYCERAAPGFGGEPLNTVTGLVFAAVGLWALARAPRFADRVAAGLLLLVGLASAAQHGWAVVATVLADSLANQAFLVALLVLMARRLAGASLAAAGAVGLAVMAGITVLAYVPAVRASLGPAADAFVILAVVLAGTAFLMRRDAVARPLALSAALLAVGLPFRFLDGALCAVWPAGTHAAWHLCNAAAMAVLLGALGRHMLAVQGAER